MFLLFSETLQRFPQNPRPWSEVNMKSHYSENILSL